MLIPFCSELFNIHVTWHMIFDESFEIYKKEIAQHNIPLFSTMFMRAKIYNQILQYMYCIWTEAHTSTYLSNAGIFSIEHLSRCIDYQYDFVDTYIYLLWASRANFDNTGEKSRLGFRYVCDRIMVVSLQFQVLVFMM